MPFCDQGDAGRGGCCSEEWHRKGDIAEAPQFGDEQRRRGILGWFCQVMQDRLRIDRMTSASTRARFILWPALACAVSGIAIFQFLGSSTRGYIQTASLFYWWCYQWINPASETQHGVLILAISAWLVARNIRREPATSDGAAHRLGVATCAMLAGLLVHALGFVAEQARLSIVGLLMFTWGATAFAGGPRWARASVFPVAFMLFAIPLSALDSAGFWLRLWVVGASASIVHAFGIHIIVNGTQLLSPDGHYDYDVAAACSGVRSLVALSALSLLIGYLWLRPLWLRVAMLALSLPLIYFGNVVRIVAIVVAAQAGGREWGDLVHEIMGYGVFAIVLGGIIGTALMLSRCRPDWAEAAYVGSRGTTEAPRREGGWGTLKGVWACAGATVATSLLVAVFLFHVSQLPPKGRCGIRLEADGLSPVELPTFIGSDWIGRRTAVTEVERQILPPDTGFSRRTYVSLSDPSKQAFLSIVLSGRDRTSIHRPELCLIGQGWTILGSFAHQFTFPDRRATIPATVLRVQSDVMTENGRVKVPDLVAYYFVGGDLIVASHWERMVRDAWNRVIHGRSDRWAYVLILTEESDGEAAALARIQTILDGTLPVFQNPG
jgi:exosortase